MQHKGRKTFIVIKACDVKEVEKKKYIGAIYEIRREISSQLTQTTPSFKTIAVRTPTTYKSAYANGKTTFRNYLTQRNPKKPTTISLLLRSMLPLSRTEPSLQQRRLKQQLGKLRK